ncbi:MAG: paraquat-inducible protein A [Phycisphaerales bacterium]|nr:paraquat-inducible protein A [Phycisphaerales bacterium]
MQDTSRKSFFLRYGAEGMVIPILLVISLTCNILGLVLPFMEIDEFLKGKVIYSLPHSVNLMWTNGLYFIAALIAVFSIIFPLVKIGCLIAAWFFPWTAAGRVKLLTIIEFLGKWSYMDIFVVILLLVLTDRQTFISSTLHSGIYFFIAAITISMLVSQGMLALAEHRLRAEQGCPELSKDRFWPAVELGLIGWSLPVLAVVSAIALLAAIDLPFLRITQAFLTSYVYSIREAVIALWQEDLYLLAIIMVGFLGVMPLLRLGILLLSWAVPMRHVQHERAKALSAGVSRWSMLDVFGIALFLIITEGRQFVKTEVQQGMYIVIAAIALSYLSSIVAGHLHRRFGGEGGTTSTTAATP